MINYYVIEIKENNPDKLFRFLIKNNINIINAKYKDNLIILKVTYDDYKKISKFKNIKVLKINGKRYFKYAFNKYKIPFICLFFSILFIYFLSNIIFYIEIDNLNEVILDELKSENITLYSLKPTYDKLNLISKRIKDNHSDMIEWINLKYYGVKLKVEVIEKKQINKDEKSDINNIVSSKNAYIKKVVTSKGEIIKNVDDYVKKGDVVISGNIIRNEKVIDQVAAEGYVYGEVWYKEIYDESIYKKEIKYLNEGYKKIIISIFDKDIVIFKIKKKFKKNYEKEIYKNSIFVIKEKFERSKKEEKKKYSPEVLKQLILKKAKKDIEKSLKKDEYIIMQKTLKSDIKDDKIYIEVFYKVYENITQKENIERILLE